MWMYNQTLSKKVGILGKEGSYHNSVLALFNALSNDNGGW